MAIWRGKDHHFELKGMYKGCDAETTIENDIATKEKAKEKEMS